MFAKLYDEFGTSARKARLPALHSQQLLSVLEKFAATPKHLGGMRGKYMTLEMWHETNAQKDGTIYRDTDFAVDPREMVLSGPHFHISTPNYKTPKAVCSSNQAYTCLDLANLPSDYLARTNYKPNVSREEYRARAPKVSWGENKPVIDFYRIACRRQLNPSSERTLLPSIAAPGVGHVDSVLSITIEDGRKIVDITGFWSSVPVDFLVKSTGKGDIRNELARQLPIPTSSISALTS